MAFSSGNAYLTVAVHDITQELCAATRGPNDEEWSFTQNHLLSLGTKPQKRVSTKDALHAQIYLL